MQLQTRVTELREYAARERDKTLHMAERPHGGVLRIPSLIRPQPETRRRYQFLKGWQRTAGSLAIEIADAACLSQTPLNQPRASTTGR